MSKVYFELWILQSFKKKTVEQETSDPLHFPLGYCAFYVEILCRKYIFLELPLLSPFSCQSVSAELHSSFL